MVLVTGASYVAYEHLSSDFVPIEERLNSLSVGITEVYDRNGPDEGVLLGKLTNPNAQLSDPVPLERISPWLIEATVSTEDNSYYSNPGVDPAGLVRAAYENYSGGGIGSGSGGSTITQQLVKNLYLSTDCVIFEGVRTCIAPRTLERKLKEVAIALKVDSQYSKDQVLGWYLNQISYGDRYIGIEAAARGYFHISAADLTLAQAALLAGVPAAPTAYHPRLNCITEDTGVCQVDEQGRTIVGGAAKERQEHVLRLMVDHGRLTAEEAEAAILEPVYVYLPLEEQRAPAWIDDQVEPRLVRMCEAGLLPKIHGATSCEESVHSAGYKVTSTLDWTQTSSATALMKQSIEAGLDAGCDCHNAAIVTIDPGTGQVMVYAPNIDPTQTSDPKVAGQIDQAVEVNQPGSSFKPLVYLAWMDKLNKTPMSSFWDTSPMKLNDPTVTEENQATITNSRSGTGGEGLITARAALGGSQNVPAFRAAAEVGVDSVIEYAGRLGITTLGQNFDPTFYDHDRVSYGPAIATGGANVRLIDMAYMNATFANMGLMVGVPTLAETLDIKKLESTSDPDAEKASIAWEQRSDFIRGDTRLPGTREIDPVVVLEVRASDGTVLYTHGTDRVEQQVVDAGSAWMLYTIQSDCTARFIIWTCGSSNSDVQLDSYMGNVKIPTGVKTGTQQGFGINDTLETWMTGYSRYAAVALWVGNSDNSLVQDGRPANFASANTTVRLFKTWMGTYHQTLKDREIFAVPLGFESLQPKNVKQARYQSATTERGRRGGCYQQLDSWQRTDITYKGDCEGKSFMPLPELAKDLAIRLAWQYGIPTTAGAPPRTATPVPSASPSQSPSPSPSVSPSPAASPTTQPPRTPTPGNNGNGNGNGNGNNQTVVPDPTRQQGSSQR